MAITVPVAGEELSVSTFGKPVADWINAATPTNWANLTLTDSWVAFSGFQVPQYRKIGDIVYLRGAMNRPTQVPDNTESNAFTLPAGFRPPATNIYVVMYGGSAGSGAFGRMQIPATGVAGIFASSSGGMIRPDVGVWFSVNFSTI